MTHELIINHQAVDITGVDITLEYVSGVFNDIGSIKFSRSYTIKLPRTALNSKILGFSGGPAQEPALARRYFMASYIRNGIDLLGDARAYLLGVTPEAYEVALIWSVLPALVAWKDAKPKLTDIKSLPDIEWPGSIADSSMALYLNPIFYATYISGLEAYSNSYESIKVAPHPCITLSELIDKIMKEAGISYSIEQTLDTELMNTVLLAAPSHKPSLAQEIESGSQAASLTWQNTKWWFKNWTNGWDAPYDSTSEATTAMQKGEADAIRVLLNLRIIGSNPDLYIKLSHGGVSVPLYPKRTDDGGYIIDEVVEMNSIGVKNDYDYYAITVEGLTKAGSYAFAKYDATLPLFAVMRVHESITLEHHDAFSVAINLPNISQYDFLKGIMGLFGVAAFIKDGEIYFEQYSRFLGTGGALDWTDKVDMSDGEGLENLSYVMEGLAQTNAIKYVDDTVLSFDPSINLHVEDSTIAGSKELIKLPFAASESSSAVHYKVSGEATGEGYEYNVEDIDIKPRIFRVEHDEEGKRFLTFPVNMYGEGARSEYYSEYQEIIRKPVVITANIRLTELDLLNLDFSRAVYLGQYGRYYYIKKVQTSDTDLCKVELIQIP